MDDAAELVWKGGRLALAHRYMDVGPIRLHYAEAGDGPLVVLLHGFPEFWYSWRKQIPALAAAGFRVIALDQRGYNQSARPSAIGAYDIDDLVADVVGVIDASGDAKAIVVGHDWGGAVAWRLALSRPDRVGGLAVLNMPHPLVFQEHLRRQLGQRLRSSYALLFQVPWLPEMVASRGRGAVLAALLGRTSRAGAFSSAELEHYRQAWVRPGAYRAMFNWYRAAARRAHRPLANPRVTVATLLIWGARDRFLGLAMAQASIDLCDQGRLVLIPNATHWVQHEAFEQVNDLLLTFARAQAEPRATLPKPSA